MRVRAASNICRQHIWMPFATLFVNFTRNRIVNTNCVGFYGHPGTTMVHMA